MLAIVVLALAGAVAGVAAGLLIARGLRRVPGAVEHGGGVVVATAVAFALVAVVFGRDLPTSSTPAAALVALFAYLVFAAVSILLAVIDVDIHRLPHRVVLPAIAAALVLLSAAALLAGDPRRILGVLGGAAALFLLYLLIRIVAPRGMGGGDVTLAALVGAHLGYLGWPSVVVGALGGFLVGGLFSVLLLLARRATRTTAVAFGPWMLVGAWGAILLARAAPERIVLPL